MEFLIRLKGATTWKILFFVESIQSKVRLLSKFRTPQTFSYNFFIAADRFSGFEYIEDTVMSTFIGAVFELLSFFLLFFRRVQRLLHKPSLALKEGKVPWRKLLMLMELCRVQNYFASPTLKDPAFLLYFFYGDRR